MFRGPIRRGFWTWMLPAVSSRRLATTTPDAGDVSHRARSSALVYLYEGLDSGESSEQVLARAGSDGAPFVRSAECGVWVEQGLRELSERSSRGSGTDGVEA